MDIDYEGLLRSWLDNPWLRHGVGTYIASNIGHFVPIAVLEFVVRQGWAQGSMMTYGGEKTREEAKQGTWKKKGFSFWEQLKNCSWNMLGPFAIACSCLSGAIHMKDPTPTELYPSLKDFLVHLLSMELLGDFFLYWGHRLQHTNKYLWDNCHHFHHTIDTPSPVSTVCIDPLDAFLQGTLPIALAQAIVNPHPLTGYFYVMVRVSENVVNHSGLDSRILDILTLKVLPFRAPVKLHDSHHRFSNYNGDAKNYGENFWVWDYLFGTYRNPDTLKAA